jgi:hypothetical protein
MCPILIEQVAIELRNNPNLLKQRNPICFDKILIVLSKLFFWNGNSNLLVVMVGDKPTSGEFDSAVSFYFSLLVGKN